VSRYLVLFAREPRREALAKGFGRPGEDLFVAFARGWLEAARCAGARLVIAAPPEDRAGWRRRVPEALEALWMAQTGRSLGERLEGVARRAARLPGSAVLVGGDVAPCPRALIESFVALEAGAECVVGPSRDGGVSLLALGAPDADLLRAVGPRQRRVAERLRRCLESRGRSIAWIETTSDIDGRRSLAAFERGLGPGATRALVRGILRAAPPLSSPIPRIDLPLLASAAGPRAPPAAA